MRSKYPDPRNDEFVIRYVVTAKQPGKTRTLTTAAQGRHTYATEEEAEAQRQGYLTNNSPERLADVGLVNLEVRACKCWPIHFDPKGVYFED